VVAARPDVARGLAATARAAAGTDHQRITGSHLEATVRWLEAQDLS
jgi:hypothetical protein